MEEVEFTRVPLFAVLNNEANYRLHTDPQLVDLKASLRRFGQVEPAVVKRQPDETYLLVAHEGVTTAAKALYHEDPHRYQGLLSWRVMIVPEHWSEADVRAYMVASNETARLSEVDDRRLATLLGEQQELGFDLHSVGMSATSYQALLEYVGDTALWEGQEEDVTAPSVLPVPQERGNTAEHPKMVMPSAPVPHDSLERYTEQMNQTQLRQLVLVMEQSRYEYMLGKFGAIREQAGLGSHADVVSHLLASYLLLHPEVAPV